jgi:serine/threonine protein kinase
MDYTKRTVNTPPDPDTSMEPIKIVDMDYIIESTTQMPDPVVVVVPDPVVVPKLEYEYEPEMDVINRWKMAARDDIIPLIAMIRQLYFFSDCRKSLVRTYAVIKDDIPKYICKINRRPELKIDVSDTNIHDHPQMFNMYRRLRTMIGIFRINDFMVRVEHAFDNSQIMSEYFVMSTIMKTDEENEEYGGIDPVHHIVIPTYVQLNNIQKIPPKERTLFHHISYSIQPIVFHSQTLDTWFKSSITTNAQIMQLCIQMAQALTYLHSLNIVHGDIKPGNTLIQTINDTDYSSGSSGSSGSSDVDTDTDLDLPSPSLPSLTLYLIDFGMSGTPGKGDGTGGTKPFCAPETGNGFNPSIDIDTYTWTKTQKHHDVWSCALMFFTIMIFRKIYLYAKDYPSDFFIASKKGHINPIYFDNMKDEPLRHLFQRALCPAEERITASDFLAQAIICASNSASASNIGNRASS